MLARLRESFDRERRFVADAGHELRTPLAVVKTELEAALRTDGDPEVRESLRAALDEADHLAQLAEDLLPGRPGHRRALAGTRRDRERARAPRQARERFADRARSEGRELRVAAPAGLEARLDPLRLRQALGNPHPQRTPPRAGAVELSARRDDGVLEIDVADEGDGFPAELAPHSFERLARGDAARSRGGTGLGLAIVSGIDEAHGGTAVIAATPGGRTVARLRFPDYAGSGGRAISTSQGA